MPENRILVLICDHCNKFFVASENFKDSQEVDGHNCCRDDLCSASFAIHWCQGNPRLCALATRLDPMNSAYCCQSSNSLKIIFKF